MRLRTGAAVAGAFAAAALCVPGGQADDPKTVVLSASYSGSYSWQDDWFGAVANGSQDEAHSTLSMTWNETFNQTISNGKVQQTTMRSAVQGHLVEKFKLEPTSDRDCTITAVQPKDPTTAPLRVSPWQSGNTLEEIVSAVIPNNIPNEVTMSGTNCYDSGPVIQVLDHAENVSLQFPGLPDAKTKAIDDALTGASLTLPLEANKTVRIASGEQKVSGDLGSGAHETATRQVTGELVVGRGSAVAPAPKPRPKRPPSAALLRAKADAQADLRLELTKAAYPCITAAAGVAIFAIPSPVIAVTVGGTMVRIAAPLCAIEIPVIKQLAEVVNDPELRNYTVVAAVPGVHPPPVSLPACTTYAQGARAFCAKLQPAALALVRAAAGVEAVAGTLETTVGRESAANAAGNAAAVAAQDRAVSALLPKLAAATSAEASAGKAFAGVLRSAGVTAVLGSAQTTKAFGVVQAKLTQAGLDAASVRSLGGPALQAKTIDYLAELAAE